MRCRPAVGASDFPKTAFVVLTVVAGTALLVSAGIALQLL